MSVLRQAISEAERQLVGELQQADEYGHVHTDVVRRLAHRLDGLRYAQNVLADEGLLDGQTPEEWRACLLPLRIASQTAAGFAPDGVGAGIDDVRTCVARLLEQAAAA